MKIKDEILTELRNGTPLEEIRGRFRSQSQLYEAIRGFLEEADQIVAETRDRLAEADSALIEAEAALDSVNRERKKVSVEVQELVDAKETLSREVNDKAEELAALNADTKELQARGFTSEIVKEIKATQDRSGPALLQAIKTAEKSRQVTKEVSDLKKEKTKLTRMIKELERKRTKMKGKLVSEKNRLDELMVQTAAFKDAVDTVRYLFSGGYSSQDITCLKQGLDTLGIQGDPVLSVCRLVEGLGKQKGLAALSEQVTAKTQELVTLKNEVAGARGKLDAVKHVILRACDEVEGQAVTAIAGEATHATAAMKNAAASFDTHLTSSMSQLDAYVRQIMASVNTELEEWSELQEQKGKLKGSIDGGVAFLGILESPEVLTKVSLPLVVQLFERLLLWCEMNMQDVRIRPSLESQNKDFRFSIYNVYDVSVLVELVYNGLKQLMIMQSRGVNAAGETACQT